MPRTVLTLKTARRAMEHAAASLPEYPDPERFAGRGVVIPGGGVKYFPSAWVCINMLRHVGCSLPIELWHLGPDEMSDEMRSLVEPLGVFCVDALEVCKQHPIRGSFAGRHAGWELKPYSIIHSRFREVLFLDADNMPVIDPTFLFDTDEYRRYGAIFWPDYGQCARDRDIWRLTGVPYRPEPECESGQIVVDKARCWKPLCLTMWMNEHSDFWYQHVFGDKDTFLFAWRKLGREYAMPATPIHTLRGVMCQHDFHGRRVFQHRSGLKWRVDATNTRVGGFHDEDVCLAFLDDLAERWTQRVGWLRIDNRVGERERALGRELCRGAWEFAIDGKTAAELQFRRGGHVEPAANETLRTWTFGQSAEPLLMVMGRDGVTHLFYPVGEQRWSGYRVTSAPSKLKTGMNDAR